MQGQRSCEDISPVAVETRDKPQLHQEAMLGQPKTKMQGEGKKALPMSVKDQLAYGRKSDVLRRCLRPTLPRWGSERRARNLAKFSK